jgi:TolB-like protein
MRTSAARNAKKKFTVSSGIIFFVSGVALLYLFSAFLLKDQKYQGGTRLNSLNLFEEPELPYVPPPYPVSTRRYAIALVPFEPAGGLTQSEADSVSDLFVYHLKPVWGINVLNRNTVEKEMSRINFPARPDDARAIQLGKNLNVNCVILGELNIISGALTVETRVIDVSLSEAKSIIPLKTTGLSGLFVPMQSYVDDLIRSLPAPCGSYRVGGIGQAGGLIFYSFYGHCMEVSEELGEYNWDDALDAAKNYSGGGFSDWRLPTLYELDLIYQTLKANGTGGFFDGSYWSSSLANPGYDVAWELDFSEGKQLKARDNAELKHVRVFRVFTSEI